MKSRERMTYAAILAFVTLVNITLLIGGAGNQAFADASSWFADVIGPASMVKFADESAEDDAETIDLMVREGHLAWGDSSHSVIYSTGYVNIARPMSALLTGETFNERRLELQDELREQATTFEEELAGLVEELQGMDQADPEFAGKNQIANARYQDYQMWNQDAQRQSAQLEATLIEEAYEEVVAAVDVVAEEQGIDIVLRFNPQGDPINAATPQQAQMIIRNRPALKYPDGLDITDAVMDELALDSE